MIFDDIDLTGFGLKASPTGTRSYIVGYRPWCWWSQSLEAKDGNRHPEKPDARGGPVPSRSAAGSSP